jgi:hypothetical protein
LDGSRSCGSGSPGLRWNKGGRAIGVLSVWLDTDQSERSRIVIAVVFNVDNYNSAYSGGTTHQLPLDGLLPACVQLRRVMAVWLPDRHYRQPMRMAA